MLLSSIQTRGGLDRKIDDKSPASPPPCSKRSDFLAQRVVKKNVQILPLHGSAS